MMMLRRLDRNQDGRLSSKEIPKSVMRFVKSQLALPGGKQALDRATGDVDLDRLAQVIRLYEQQRSDVDAKKKGAKDLTDAECLKYAAQLISNYDLNKDQHLQADEFEKLSVKWIECDLNSDLQLDVVEVACGLKHALDIPRDIRRSSIRNGEAFKKTMARSAANPARQRPSEANVSPRKMATMLVANYDRDQNGRLNKKELASIGPSWNTVDFDKDGEATVDEIQVRMEQYVEQGREKLAVSKSDSVRSTHNGARDSASPTMANERFRSKDFRELDENQNGQIEMHEFSQEFDQSVVLDFYRRDRNQDGVITLNEWNRFLADEKKAKQQEEEALDESAKTSR